MTTLLGICVVLLLVAVVGFGALWYFSFSNNAKLKRQIEQQEARARQMELDRKKGAADEALALARSSQTEALVAVRRATNALGELQQSAAAVRDHLSALQSNSTGKEIALYPDLVSLARRVYESDSAELPTQAAIVERTESLRRIEQQLLEAQGTAYTPDESLKTTISRTHSWSDAGMERVKIVESALRALERESRVKIYSGTRPAQPMTLAAAMSVATETETTRREQTIVEKTSAAKTNATDLVAKAEAEKILADAKAKAESILREAEESAAARKREAEIKKAEETAKDTATNLKSKQILDQATHQKLVAKCSDASVRQKLLPLTTPGYLQNRKIDVEKKAVSLSVLEAAGALNPTADGMNMLVRIVTTKDDKVRPRLSWTPNNGWKRRPDQIEEIKELQTLLIELGPVLVEQGLLAP